MSESNEELIERLQKEIKDGNDQRAEYIKIAHEDVEDKFYEHRRKIIDNIKSYITNISIVVATIIPFSTLVFQIPPTILVVNVYVWLISVVLFVISLTILIFLYIKLVKTERSSYIDLLFKKMDSGQIDYVTLMHKDESEKIFEHIKILDAQRDFRNLLRSNIEEKDFVFMSVYFIRASFVLIAGLFIFFLSMPFNDIVQFLSPMIRNL